MKKINLALAQSSYEFDFILKKANKNLTLVPLNLETLLYCKKIELDYLNPIDFLDNKFHEECLVESEKLINSLDYDSHMEEYMMNRYRGIIRKFFNSSFFIHQIIEKIEEGYEIEQIYVSGWNSFDFTDIKKNYFTTLICRELFEKRKVNILENRTINENKIINNFFIEKKKKLNIKYILISNLGYNFFRIILCAYKKKFKVAVFSFEKINYFKKMVYLILGVHILKIQKKTYNDKTSLNLPDINYSFKKRNFSNLLNLRKLQSINELQELKNLSILFNDFFSNNKPSLILLNMIRGMNGYFSEMGKKFNIPCLYISHGTISESNNKFSKIYNNIIAEELISQDSNIFCLQSKISKSYSLESRKGKKNLETGNIIYSESKKKKNEYILYAVTNRDFVNMQYYGIETFYEFYKNLQIFDSIIKKNNLNFLIKLHPGIAYLKKDLERNFSNLKFTNKQLKKVMPNAFVTVSFSSTAIEDSLCSEVPVILFDNWKRYKHCSAEENPNELDKAVYYVNNSESFLTAINSIKNSTKINFQSYIYKTKSMDNILKKIFPLMQN